MNDMENMTANSDVQRLDFNTPALQRKRRMRALKDHWRAGTCPSAVWRYWVLSPSYSFI